MYYVNNKLIVTSHSFSKSKQDFMRVYHQDTGELLLELPRCHASSCVVALEIQGKEHVLEGCSICQIIRGYELQEATGNPRVLLKGIRPLADLRGGARDAPPPGVQILSFLCSFWQKNCKIIAVLGVGAPSSGKSWIRHCRPSHMNKWTNSDAIMVFEEELKFINLLQYSAHQFQIVGKKFPVWLHNIAEICYSKCSPYAMFLHNNKKIVSAVVLGTSQIAWQHTKTGSFINDIATIPDGQICTVINYKKFCVLDPKNGAILYTLPDSEHLKLGVVYSVATCYSNNQQRLALQHGKPEDTRISCCKVKSTQPPKVKSKKPLPWDYGNHINMGELVSNEANLDARN